MTEAVRHCIDIRDGKTPAEMRESVVALEAVMRAMPQIDIPIEHFFSPGVYMRQMTMPAGSVVVGKIHKMEHHCILAKGSVSVVTDDGVKDFTAPAVIHAMPGAKRALHAHSEVVWINVHHNPDDGRDVDAIEERLIAKTFAEVPSAPAVVQIQGGDGLCHSSR